ncbi:MAG: SUMF1/EgtB/PvdO family nonheme iron enzyme [Magnetococcales bacterium]|nr:SUMF1/EgtB/PvdO family nonheme iron enzyme [Magnetococcales bacterium]
MAIIITSRNEKPAPEIKADFSQLKRVVDVEPIASKTPGRDECLHLLAMAEQIVAVVPKYAHRFANWQKKASSLLDDADLETLAGNSRLDSLAMELRSLWLEIAHRYSDPHLKSPPAGADKRLPLGLSAKFKYERLVYPRNLEKRCPDYRPSPEGWDCEHILFRSGLSAIAALFQVFGQVLSKDNKSIVNIDMFGGYFETEQILQAFASPLFHYQRIVKQAELFLRVEREKADVLFLEPVSYDWDLEALDFEQLLNSLSLRATPPKVVVVDSTIVGNSFPLQQFISMLPGSPPPLVVVLSSGLKLDQEGLELANVGILSLFYRQEHKKVEKIAMSLAAKMRKNRNLFGNGLLMDEMSVLDVPWFLDGKRFETHCSRVFANNSRLAKTISPIIKQRRGIFSRISHPSISSTAQWPWAKAPFVVFHFNPEQDSEENHKFLVAAILQLSAERSLGLVNGMSFGFRGSRFEIIKPNAILHPNGKQKGLLKVAMGSRNGVAVDGIIELLAEVAGMSSCEELGTTYPKTKQKAEIKNLEVGDNIIDERYEILERVGAGNFALVFKVRELSTGNLFAAKQATVARKAHVYESEVEKLAILRGGPHILQLHESMVDENGAMIMVTEYLDGGTLKEAILSRGHLSEVEALGVLGQIAKAVAYAHSRTPPILHRDIKPSNILGKIVGKNRIKWYLADWGLAASWRNAREPAVSGTHSYTAPEVWRKKRYLVSEVYSLGMTLYFMLFGRPAYEGVSASITSAQKSPEPVVIPPGCPDNLKKILEGMLEKNPKKRWSLDKVIAEVLPDKSRKKPALVLRTRIPAAKKWQVSAFGATLAFHWIPPGKFTMGQSSYEEQLFNRSADNRSSPGFGRERPAHVVQLDGFWICRTPVTRGDFASFQKASGYKTISEREGWCNVWNPVSGQLEKSEGGDWSDSGFTYDESHPVVNVAYEDAMAMAEWLSKQCHRLITLPTEAQWEYACRGGVAAPFNFGNKIHTGQANFNGRKEGQFNPAGEFHGGTTPVEQFSGFANGYGLLDMHGNVFEWTRDWYEENFYQNSPLINPRSSWSTTAQRVIRGGSWLSPALRIRSAYRDRFDPGNRDAEIGFRLVGLAYPWER